MKPTTLSNNYNFFFICGHGVKYATQIIAKIEAVKSLELITSIFYQPPKIKKFVSKVFQLEDKSEISVGEIVKYIKQTSKIIIVVVVKNCTDSRVYNKDGVKKRFYNKTITDVENNIRDKFEKRSMGSNNNRAHIIYGFVNPSSTDIILRWLKICYGTYEFEKICIGGIPYYIRNWTRIQIKKMNLDEIYARIPIDGISRIVKIEDTPHYRSLINGMVRGGDYDNYLLYHQGLNPYSYYTLDKYRNLSETLEYTTNNYRDKYIFVKYTEGKYVILDGLHRAAILKYRGVQRLIVAEVNF